MVGEGPVGEDGVSSQETPIASRGSSHGAHGTRSAAGMAVREFDVLHLSSKILPHGQTWPTGWKPGGHSRRTICELEVQHFPSLGAKQRGGS